jgi:cell division protein FtsQ
MARAAAKPTGSRRRLWIGGMILGIAGVSSGMAALKVRQFTLTDSQFIISRDDRNALTIQGLRYTPRTRVQRVFADDYGRSAFQAPLGERRRRLMGIDWVQEASVSRIWPNRLAVRLTERKPVAFVLFRTGVLLIDSQGVLLEPPAQAQFTFPVLSGVREDENEAQRRERVRTFQRVQEELGYLAKDVSEVNAADPDNVRIVAQVDNRAVELILGGGNFARRYQNFINHYSEIRKRSPEVRTFDLRLDDRITAKE